VRYACSRYQPALDSIRSDRLLDHALAMQESPASAPAAGEGSTLTRFTPNLTAEPRYGRLAPGLCPCEGQRQVLDILARRRKNNPIVIGDAGVGKTAVVEGLALRIVAGEVPEALRDVDLLALDMGLLQAGASIKGEFERRLQAVIDEVRSAARPVILFI